MMLHFNRTAEQRLFERYVGDYWDGKLGDEQFVRKSHDLGIEPEKIQDALIGLRIEDGILDGGWL